MLNDSAQTITVTDATRSFTQAIRTADENGAVLILENNRPKYKLINLEVEPDFELTDDEKIAIVARRILKRFKPAFIELAK